MTTPIAETAAAKSQPKPRGGASWGSRSFGRESVKLKLMGSLRGEGLLVLADREIAAAYELDVYARGATHTATGHLEGDFSAFSDPDGEAPAARLRMNDGREIGIDLSDVEPDMADFAACGEVPADLLAKAPAA